jgi:hypothetical protein
LAFASRRRRLRGHGAATTSSENEAMDAGLSERLIFLHIIKTAGTSFMALL